MIQLLKKEDQFNATLFAGNFIVNKPVANGSLPNIKPYSSLFYWSHAQALDACEFALHPHQGFEIMTFIIEGSIMHFDTASRVWTSLESGDFQIIQSNRGMQHQERIAKGTHSFQIWFDPDFSQVMTEEPAYTDYHSKNFKARIENGIQTICYVGENSTAVVLTPGVTIKRLFPDKNSKCNLALDVNSSYTFYILKGKASHEGYELKQDDALRVKNEDLLSMSFEADAELFFIQTPAQARYKMVWE